MRFQIIISICAGVIPILAFFFLIPKKKIKIMKEAPKEKEEKPAQLSEKETNTINSNKSYNNYKKSLEDEFIRYARAKQSSTPKPKPKVAVSDSNSRVEFGLPRPNLEISSNKDMTVIDEFNSSSDELKTLIISGFLDRKDYEGEDL